jgi:hypothetical protein
VECALGHRTGVTQWSVLCDGQRGMAYVSQEAAFEVPVSAAGASCAEATRSGSKESVLPVIGRETGRRASQPSPRPLRRRYVSGGNSPVAALL